jgi:Dolichyl-phosphate-mannose-protein mannosyltransferase
MKFFERPLLLALGISAALLTVVVASPLSVDNLIYQSMALDLLRHGKIPYLGSWDQNFPGIILVHYMAIVLFGTHDISLRFLDLILQLGFAVLFYIFCRFWLQERAAAITVVLYIFYYVSGRGSIYGERDVYGVMAIIAGLYFIYRGTQIGKSLNSHWDGCLELIIAGFFVGYSIIIRPTFVLSYVLIAVFLFSIRKQTMGIWKQCQSVLLFCIAGMAPLLLLLLVYRAIPGGLHALYMATIRFNLDVYTKFNGAPEFLTLLGIFIFFLGRGYLIPLAMVGRIALRNKSHSRPPRSPNPFLLRRLTRSEQWLYYSLLLSFLAIAIIQRKYLAYHFTPVYVLLCPFSAIGVEWMLTHLRGWFVRTSAVLVLVSLYIIFMVGDRREIVGFVQALFEGRNPVEAAYTMHHFSPSFGAVPQREVLHFLSLPGNDTGSLEICSFEPALRTHLNRTFASPYVMPTAIAWSMDGGVLTTPQFTNYQMAWRRAYLDSLCINRPIFIILARNTVCWNLCDPYRTYLHNLPGFDSLLQASYRYDTAFGCYQIFRRKH